MNHKTRCPRCNTWGTRDALGVYTQQDKSFKCKECGYGEVRKKIDISKYLAKIITKNYKLLKELGR